MRDFRRFRAHFHVGALADDRLRGTDHAKRFQRATVSADGLRGTDCADGLQCAAADFAYGFRGCGCADGFQCAAADCADGFRGGGCADGFRRASNSQQRASGSASRSTSSVVADYHNGAREARARRLRRGIGQLPASSVDLVIADPPYNIAVQGSAWDTVPDYLAWSAGWLKASIAALRPGGSLFLYGSPAKLWIDRLKLVAAELGLEYVQHISWVYKQGGDSRLTHMTSYSVRMEYLEWFVKPGGPPTSRQEGRIALGSAGPYVDADSWDIPRENSRSKERAYGPPHHPSMKPLRLCDRLVEGHSRPGEVVLVPFGGSGSECVSVVQAGRKLIAFETDGAYYELILRRMHGHGLLPSSLQPLGALGDGAAAADDDEQQLMRNGRYTSGYMGVFKHGQKWVAKVMRDGAFRNIGIFATAKEAARAYRDVCASDPDDERPGNQVDEARAAKRAAKRAGEGLVRGGERRAERSEPPVQAEPTLNTALSSTLISSRTVARSSEEGNPLVGALGDVPSAPLFRAPMGPPMPNKEGPNKEGPIGVLPRRASPSCRASAAAAATHEGAPARLGGPNKEGPDKEGPEGAPARLGGPNEEGPDKEGPEGAPARLGERAAEALAAVRTKPPPGWTKVMDFGKLKGYRSRDGRKAMSLPAAWRLYDDEQ